MLDGDDIILGGDGNDELGADRGSDTIIAGAGDDAAYGGFFTGDDGDGNDIVGLPWDTVETGDDNLLGGAGDDALDGGPGFDALDGQDSCLKARQGLRAALSHCESHAGGRYDAAAGTQPLADLMTRD